MWTDDRFEPPCTLTNTLSLACLSLNYSYNTEPTNDWTVEESFQWMLLRSLREADDEYTSQCKELVDLFESLETELMRQVDQANNNNQYNGVDQENQKPRNTNTAVNAAMNHGNLKVDTTAGGSRPHVQESQKIATKSVAKSSATTSAKARVDLTAGPYAGNVFEMSPTQSTPCRVGRSRGKMFKTKGISLPKDLEVSTTHGQFHLNQAGRICFTDLTSTNGTTIRGETVAPDSPVELVDGMEILIGQTMMKMTLL
jgi:hypothetical protein